MYKGNIPVRPPAKVKAIESCYLYALLVRFPEASSQPRSKTTLDGSLDWFSKALLVFLFTILKSTQAS